MIVRAIVKGVANIYCHLVYKMEVKGLENIPKEGAAIICPNHIHFMDSISVVIYIKRMIYPMSKEELFRNKFMAWFMRQLGCYPIRRGKGDSEAIEFSKKLLREKKLLLLFPEGTRNGLEKGLRFKKGAALLALYENVPIIPVGIKGTFKPFSKVTLNFGKPITLEKYKTGEEADPREIITLTNEIKDEVVRLRDNYWLFM